MKLDDIITSWEEDTKINPEDIGGETLNTPKLHSKYLKLFANESALLKKYKADHKRLYRIKWEYYLGLLSIDQLKELDWEPFQFKILKSELPMYLDGDDDVSQHLIKMEMQQEKVNLLDQIIKSINNRNFVFKNYIDWKKFENGVA